MYSVYKVNAPLKLLYGKHRTPEKKSKHSDKSRDSGRDRKRERSGSSHKSPKKKSRHH